MTPSKLKISIIEDNQLLLASVRALILKQRDMELVSLLSEINLENRVMPNVVLLSVCDSSLTTICSVSKKFSSAKLIVMNLGLTDSRLLSFVRSGVRGFVLKSAGPEEIIGTIWKVVEGEFVVPYILALAICQQLQDLQKPDLSFLTTRITFRERQVIECVLQGLTNKEVGERLNIAVHTVKIHVHNILGKLGLERRVELMSLIARHTSETGTKDNIAIRCFTAPTGSSVVNQSSS